jgi:hypothetical protein
MFYKKMFALLKRLLTFAARKRGRKEREESGKGGRDFQKIKMKKVLEK